MVISIYEDILTYKDTPIYKDILIYGRQEENPKESYLDHPPGQFAKRKFNKMQVSM